MSVHELMTRFPLVVAWLHGGPEPQAVDLALYLDAWHTSEPGLGPNGMDWSGRAGALLARLVLAGVPHD